MATHYGSTCIIHLIRNTFRMASTRDWDALKRDVKPIYTAINADAAHAAMNELAERWGTSYGAIIDPSGHALSNDHVAPGRADPQSRRVRFGDSGGLFPRV